MLNQKCPFFYEMDDILGSRANIVPPVIVQPGSVQLNLVDTAAPEHTSDPATPTGGNESTSTSVDAIVLSSCEEKDY